MHWWIPLYILLLISSPIMAGGLIYYTWHNQQPLGARGFMGMLICSILSNTIALARVFSPSIELASFFTYLHLPIVTSMPVFALLIATDFYQLPAKLRKYTPALFIVPVITLIFAFLPVTHSLIFNSLDFQQVSGLYLFNILDENIWYWISIFYSYGLLSLTVFVLVQLIVQQSVAKYRWQYILSLIGISIPFVATIVDILINQQDAHVYITPIFTNVTFPFLYWAIFRFQLLDLAPIAREQVFDEIGDAVFILDKQNRLLDMNPAACELTGFKLSEAIGLTVQEIFSNYQMEATRMGNTKSREVEFEIETRHHEKIFLGIRFSPLRKNGQELGRILIASDITKRKQMEIQSLNAKLEHERMKVLTTFISHVSHEFRTPLSVIQTNAYLMARTEDGDKRKERLYLINNQVDRVNKLSEEMLLMTRLDSLTNLVRKPVEIHSLIRTVVDKYRDKWQVKPLKVAYDFDKNMPQIEADVDLLFLAFDALLNNSIRYTPAGGSILLRSAVEKDYIKLSIIDNGVGIDNSQIQYIFDSFYRIDQAHSTVGFGLGLAIVKRVINLHQGEIQVISAINQGASFIVQLPICAAR